MSRYPALLLLILLCAAHADEGMWQPRQLPQLAAQLKQAGLKIPPQDLSDLTDYPMGAIVGLGYCSASFVSPEGLVVTNHHCVQQILQHNSTPDSNLIESGYLAEAYDEELPGGPGQRILVTVQVEDVSTKMLGGLDDGIDGLLRKQTLESREKELVAECENEPRYRCKVHAFFDGLSFFLIRQLEILDVRLVYAPARNIGEFGGDIDNWMWPRHTGDYSFLRAYVAADGKPAAYSRDNEPYRPEHHLTVATGGLAEGDFTMALGYPGQTYRHRLASEAAQISRWYYPLRKQLYEQMLGLINDQTAQRPDAAIKYNSLVQGLNNVIKNYGGMIEGFDRSGLVARKKQRERELSLWLEQQEFANAPLADLDKLVSEYRSGREQRMYYRDFLRRRATLLTAATRIYRLSKEKEKPDAGREPGYQERDWPRIRESLERIESSFDAQADQALLLHHLALYNEQLQADQRVAPLDRWFDLDGKKFDSKRIGRLADDMYSRTRLGDTATRIELMQASPDSLESSEDPFIRLAVKLYADDLAREETEKRFQGRFQLARSQYMEALGQWLKQQGKPLYPDANGTLRVTFGQVTGYQPRDGVRYTPFTTVAGVAAKHTGQAPFDAPAALLAAIGREHFGVFADAELGTVPVNFLATLDSTGGNSGSAVLNAEGELVGLLFDGNYESINADWYFEPEITRTICVDMRYVLWIMETVDGAHRLLREMGLGPAALHARRPPASVN
ncbi:MAG: S46 family peptidase [Gammaproteobacteria bacterium]|nr:S46 family peptidase [Gammaproteobacteria bacterium]NNF61070.1 S46 family peptidase [Gammaproteobacteria bacterium]NNM21417.1 S46 family peptidase [Gammaproteobacteria bacterium]